MSSALLESPVSIKHSSILSKDADSKLNTWCLLPEAEVGDPTQGENPPEEEEVRVPWLGTLTTRKTLRNLKAIKILKMRQKRNKTKLTLLPWKTRKASPRQVGKLPLRKEEPILWQNREPSEYQLLNLKLIKLRRMPIRMNEFLKRNISFPRTYW